MFRLFTNLFTLAGRDFPKTRELFIIMPISINQLIIISIYEAHVFKCNHFINYLLGSSIASLHWKADGQIASRMVWLIISWQKRHFRKKRKDLKVLFYFLSCSFYLSFFVSRYFLQDSSDKSAFALKDHPVWTLDLSVIFPYETAWKKSNSQITET